MAGRLTRVARPLVLAGLMAATAKAADRPFAHPERVKYDGHCMTIDGHDMVVYSGAFHYFRCPKELWADRFAKIKAAGFNTVETYVAWNRQEIEMPASPDDFSKVDLRDVEDWLNLAERNGLYVIIRPGPYICAEFDRGGFPGWLALKKPARPKEALWMRSDDPVFVDWSRHWYRAVAPMLARHQITRRKPGEPGIIMFQLENEYGFPDLSDRVKTAYVKALAEAATAAGIDVPMFTCWTGCVRGSRDPVLRGVFDSCNFYTGWKVDDTRWNIKGLREQQPDAPLMTTELQGGWFNGTNDESPLRPDEDHYREDLVPAQITNLTLFAWQNGETITNYYMLFGGTNLGDTAARGIATTYDYSAPIRENGGVGEKYLRVKALGEMIREHGARLARAEAVDCDVSGVQKDVDVAERRAADGGRYLFVRTHQHEQPRSGTAHVKEKADGGAELTFDYQLEPFGSKVLYLPAGVTDAGHGEWLPKEQPAVARPTGLPAAVKITTSAYMADPGPTAWKPVQAGHSLNQAGIYDSRFVFYHAHLNLPAGSTAGAAGQLAVDHSEGDTLVAVVNGTRAALKGGRLAPARPLQTGDNDVRLLFENTGCSNGGDGMEKLAGVSRLRLVPAARPDDAVSGWKMHPISDTKHVDKLPEVLEAASDNDWPATTTDAARQLAEQKSAVFRTHVKVTGEDLSRGRTTLVFNCVDDDGWVFVNGKEIGVAKSWDQTYEFDAAKELHEGDNVIAVVVHNGGGTGGLGPVAWETAGGTGDGVALEYSDQSAGAAGQWQKADLDDAGWTRETLPESPSADTDLLTWHRLSFELPASAAGTWVPWLVRLQASGNGFIYLNGHPLGRYWEGGQHDYFLPECWLNAGPGKKNVIALSLRPGGKGTAVESAEVLPYSYYAEVRGHEPAKP